MEEIKAWVWRQNITFIDAFKTFDYDFDGQVSKTDFRKALVKLVGINPRDLTKQRLDKLFEICNQSRMPNLQPGDFEKLLNGEREGSIGRIIRLISQRMGSKFDTIEASYEAASKGKNKVNLANLMDFLTRYQLI